MPAAKAVDRGPWTTEVIDLARAAAGGMLFGIPLLYTMEVWWIGSFTQPERMLAVLLLTFVPVFILNRTAGFRSTKDVRLRDALTDSIETLALGLVSVVLILVLLREISGATPIQEALGKAVYEATPFGIGIGLARHFLRRGRAEGDGEGKKTASHSVNATVADVGATAIGSVFVAFNIAPTDEVPMLAAAMGPPWLLALVGASILVSYGIVFEAGFSNQEQRRTQPGILQHPITETVAAYLVALATAALMLWFFQQLSVGDPWEANLSRVIVLGLPAAVGGAAGRLAV